MKKLKALSEEYPELNTVAEIIADITAREINKMIPHIKTKCPYPAQCVLEMVIKILEDKV
jgi:hypothetical protein